VAIAFLKYLWSFNSSEFDLKRGNAKWIKRANHQQHMEELRERYEHDIYSFEVCTNARQTFSRTPIHKLALMIPIDLQSTF